MAEVVPNKTWGARRFVFTVPFHRFIHLGLHNGHLLVRKLREKKKAPRRVRSKPFLFKYTY